MMTVAVTSQDFHKVSGHAGRCHRFLVFRVGADGQPRLTEKLDLPAEQAVHTWGDADGHPVYGVDALLSASAGDGFVQKLARRGIDVVLTSERDPVRAVAAYAAGTLPRNDAHSCLGETAHGLAGRLFRRLTGGASRATS